MPVLSTSGADRHTCLTGTLSEAFALCRTYPKDDMRHIGLGLEKRDT
jgi:hypothetical protein